MALVMAACVVGSVLLGRRGPAQAAFSPKEIAEIDELDGVDVVVRPDEAQLDAVAQRVDANGDGRISDAEFGRRMAAIQQVMAATPGVRLLSATLMALEHLVTVWNAVARDAPLLLSLPLFTDT